MIYGFHVGRLEIDVWMHIQHGDAFLGFEHVKMVKSNGGKHHGNSRHVQCQIVTIPVFTNHWNLQCGNGFFLALGGSTSWFLVVGVSTTRMMISSIQFEGWLIFHKPAYFFCTPWLRKAPYYPSNIPYRSLIYPSTISHLLSHQCNMTSIIHFPYFPLAMLSFRLHAAVQPMGKHSRRAWRWPLHVTPAMNGILGKFIADNHRSVQNSSFPVNPSFELVVIHAIGNRTSNIWSLAYYFLDLRETLDGHHLNEEQHHTTPIYSKY